MVTKGILTVEDACLCQDLGVDAIVVSNHRGRQLDAAPLIPQVLPHIRAAVDPELPLIADSGVRSGLDIARLIACGANFVLIGRPFAYAVAAAGEAGVDHAIFLLREELKQTLSQIGCQRLQDLAAHRIKKVRNYTLQTLADDSNQSVNCCFAQRSSLAILSTPM